MLIPKVSVLMPGYNAEKYVGESIQSILDQSFKDFEFIIIDDCSKDKTWEIINDFAKKDDRIVVFKNEKNLGIAENRNKLISKANGKYVVWQDADDISLPERIEHQYNFMESHLDVGISGGWLQFFNEKGNITIQKYDSNDHNLRKNIFKFSPIAQPASVIRKEVFNKVGNYDTTLRQAEDLDMSFRIGQYYKFANLQEVLVKYRRHGDSVSFNKIKENIRDTAIVRHRAVQSYGYRMSLADKFVYYVSYLFRFASPQITNYIFNFFRNYQ